MEHHSLMSVADRLHRAPGIFAKKRDDVADAVPFHVDIAERMSAFLGGTPMRVLLAASAAGLAIGAFLTDYQ